MNMFREFRYPAITLDRFKEMRAKPAAKRICFGSTHKNALKQKNDKGVSYLNLPFLESIGSVLPWTMSPSKFGGYYRAVTEESEFSSIHKWLSENADVVFIRSLFNSAVAACEHYIAPDQRSAVGELERKAKYDNSAAARGELVAVLENIVGRMHGGRKIDAVVSVPPSTPGTISLPNYLAAKLAEKLGVPDLTGSLRWAGKKPSVKELGVDEKWGVLEGVGLVVDNTVKEKNLLLIDDMYQSGSTSHFVGSRLRAAGANEIHLVAVSKGRRDTDNVG